jgi:hypothetical protein
MRRRQVPIPPRQKAAIHAVRDMLGAVIAAGKRANQRLTKAQVRFGITSDEYLAEKAGYDETQRLLDGLHPFLLDRLHTLEAPFKETW